MDPFTILAIMTALSAGTSVYAQTEAGKAQSRSLKEQAKQEEVAAQSQELQRRQELNRALAANVAAQSVSGLAGEGTPASLALASAKQVGLSESTFDVSENLRQAALKRQAKAAKQAGYIAGASTLLKSGLQVAQLAATGSPGGPSGDSPGGSSGGGVPRA
jgi:hypothetical protein